MLQWAIRSRSNHGVTDGERLRGERGVCGVGAYAGNGCVQLHIRFPSRAMSRDVAPHHHNVLRDHALGRQ